MEEIEGSYCFQQGHMPNLEFYKHYRNLGRFRQIVTVLVKYGFGEILDRMNLAGILRLGGKRLFVRQRQIAAAHWTERIRLALEELGPTFVKIGQIMSTRPFLIPVELVQELSKLQDSVAPFPFENVEGIVEEDLDKPIQDLFTSFERVPLASASMAQVHRAVLRSGENVAVKVQRPQVKIILDKDLPILRDLAVLLDRYVPEVKPFDPVAIVDEIIKVSRQEIDFTFEARNLEIFGRNFADDGRVFVPKIYWELTSSRVLTLEYIEGIKISEVGRLREAGIDPQEIIRIGGSVVAKQIFEHGFFHADPHPGNLFAIPGNRIAFVDFGMMGKLSRSALELVSDLLVAATSEDTRRVVRVFQNHDLLADDARAAALETDMSLFLQRYHGVPLERLQMRSLLADAFQIITSNRIRFPAELIMLGKALGTFEEVARMLYPQYIFINEVLPSIRKLESRKFAPRNMISDFSSYLLDLRELVVNLPFEFRRIMRSLRKGELSIAFQHKGLEQFILELEKASNRIAFALIIAAIIVGSSLIMTRPFGLTVYGVPVLGLLGFVTAGVLGIWLVIAILRSGKL